MKIYTWVQVEDDPKNNIKHAPNDNKKLDKNPNRKTVITNNFSPANNSKGPIIKEIKSSGYLYY